MAYNKPQDIDGFITQMSKADMRVKAALAEDLVTYLGDYENSIQCMDLGLLVDGLIPWLIGSHFKIAQRALEAFTELIGRLGQDFAAYTPVVLPHVVDRLGDSRDTVREKAQILLHKLMESRVLTPQQLLDKLTVCFKHKNANLREEFLQTIVNTLNEYGTQSISVKPYIQPIVSLLSDPTSNVRDAAIQTLVEIYKHVGDKLRLDLRKKEVPAAKLNLLEQKFDEIKSDGLLLPSALTAAAFDEPDTPVAAMLKQRLNVKRGVGVVGSARKPQTLDVPMSGDAGAVTWEVFEASFELVPQLNIYSQRDMEETLKSINLIIGDKTMDWEKRVDALKKIRSLLLINIQNTPIFPQYIKDLSISFLDILKELRSQVIREACITIAYMSKTLKNKLEQFSSYIFQELINLIQNSAKIISSAGTIAVKYVIKYTHTPKLIPILTQNLMQSKSKDIRSQICALMGLLFDEWQTKSMERYAIPLKDALKKGISDADNDARKFSRRNYWGFKQHFPDIAESLYNSLDPSSQKTLDRESNVNGACSMSASLRGSNSSLNSMPGSVIKRRQSSGLKSPATANPSASTSTENLTIVSRLQRAPSLPRTYNRNRSGIPVAHKEPPTPPPQPQRAGFRSISAVDTAAAQRARARAQYSNLARLKVTSGTASLQGHVAQQARQKKMIGGPPSSVTPQQASPEHRVQSRRAGVSQSQPTSRSTSPSSRGNTYGTYSSYRPIATLPKKVSGIPRSLANSRETSPTRTQIGGIAKRSVYATGSPRRPERPPINPSKPVLAQKMLLASREAEHALADALSPDDSDINRLHLNRKINRDESDESEASSVCSERSFDSSFRRNDSGSWNGSRNKLDSCRLIEDIDTIIYYCSSTHWAERKDGLTSLTHYLSNGQRLSQQQLKDVLDLFRKMFMDTHTKVYSLFLDTVNELIILHSSDLYDWLFILLTRLFNKIGTELLGSMHGKILKTLDLVHEFFPADLQMKAIFRIIVDTLQTPSLKTKIAQLNFLTKLATSYCTTSEFPTQSPADKAVFKIVQMSADKKSLELRGKARQCIIALYNCNTPNMTMFLSGLPKSHQDEARSIIQQHLHKSSSGNNSPSSPMSCSSPKLLLSPQPGLYSLQNHSSPRSRQSSVEHNDSSITTEEVYRNLRKTTAEIQNYSFEMKLDRDTNSKDSGISQMGAGDHHIVDHHQQYHPNGGINGHLRLDKEDSSCNGSKTQSATTTESNTPESTVRLDNIDGAVLHGTKNATSQKSVINYTISDSGELITESLKESDIIKTAIILDLDTNPEIVIVALNNLSICIKYGNCELPVKNFKAIMKMLHTLLQSQNNDVIIAALTTLAKVMRSTQMKPSWSNFLELILLKIIDCYKTSKEVSREIDVILPKIASVLPLDATLNLLNPVIATGEFPSNLCAIKLLTELANFQSGEITDQHLDSFMPNIAYRAEDKQSMVRKAAVLCIVRLYVMLGEEKVKPKFSLFSSSKIRLLNVYIEKESKKASS